MEGKHNLDSFKVGSLPTLMYIPEFITHNEQTNLLNNINGAPVSKWKSLKNRRLQNWGVLTMTLIRFEVFNSFTSMKSLGGKQITSLLHCFEFFVMVFLAGGVVHEKGLLSQDLPPWLMKVSQKIYEETGLFPSPINHVLINEYLPNQGIMPHQDGPAYFPVVAILSLGSPVVMDFTPHSRFRVCTSTHTEDVKEESFDEGDSETGKDKWLNNHHPFSVLLMPQSLLIFKDTAYSDYLHGIKDTTTQCFNGAVNEVVGLNQKEVYPELSGDFRSIQRTTNRISLTCRLVLKVHKNLFKF